MGKVHFPEDKNTETVITCEHGPRSWPVDIYAQAFLIPYLQPKFLLAAGSGISIPTATDRQLGTGKLIVPRWSLPSGIFQSEGSFSSRCKISSQLQASTTGRMSIS